MKRKQTNSLWSEIVKNRTIYLFISPFFIIFTVFGLFPIIFAAFLSFHKWDGVGSMTFVGLGQFKGLFSDPLFWESIYNTIVIALMGMIPTLVIAIIVASLINLTITKFKDFFRVAYFLPYVTAAVAIAIIFQSLFGTNYGLVNYLLGLFGLDNVAWLQSSWGVKFVIASMIIWQGAGYNIILYLAGLQNIPTELYEAARVDGANLFQTFRKITLPLLKPMILFTVIMSTIGGFQIFTEPQVLAENGTTPIKGSMTIVLYLYREAFNYSNFGFAAAASWIVFVLILVFSLINYVLLERPQGKGGKDR